MYPDAIAGPRAALQLHERRLAPLRARRRLRQHVDGIERATRLILDICGGEPGPTVDKSARLPKRKPVRVRAARAPKIIGIPLAAKEIGAVFSKLAASSSGSSGDAFIVTPPSYRFDLAIEEDLIEEVARIHGFERIPAQPPRVAGGDAAGGRGAALAARAARGTGRARLPRGDQLQLRRARNGRPISRAIARAARSGCSTRSPASSR